MVAFLRKARAHSLNLEVLYEHPADVVGFLKGVV